MVGRRSHHDQSRSRATLGAAGARDWRHPWLWRGDGPSSRRHCSRGVVATARTVPEAHPFPVIVSDASGPSPRLTLGASLELLHGIDGIDKVLHNVADQTRRPSTLLTHEDWQPELSANLLAAVRLDCKLARYPAATTRHRSAGGPTDLVPRGASSELCHRRQGSSSMARSHRLTLIARR